MRTVIFANGQLTTPVELLQDDFIIAADGGARHCLSLGIQPAIVIGDLDSLDDHMLTRLRDSGATIIQHPTHKDHTDLELALQFAGQRNYQQAGEVKFPEVLILGALGSRWDQTIANLLLPALFPDLSIRLVDGNQEFIYLRGEQSQDKALEIHGKPGDILSLIPLGGSAREVTIQGVEYPLDKETLVFGSSRGISNDLLSPIATVSLKEGLLLCTINHL